MTTFESLLTTFEEASEAVTKIGLYLKPNHYNQVKLVQIPDTHCIETNSLFKHFLDSSETHDYCPPSLEQIEKHLKRIFCLKVELFILTEKILEG